MKQLLIIAFAVSISLIAGCGKSAPTDTVESLVANPERLKELRAQCKADHAKVGDAVCGAVSEATRRRFMGTGTPYTPYVSPAAPQPATPAVSSPKD
ncbi:EexN family lipoprotein [Polaromonas sp.]|uniref:EexN family lipoprotein n=1 Tax=Polaromonas sp. TaxID=1869339 RepID=UPI00272F5300|nr:EexN family lipoprotein [Polaromonas sp.]MDP1743081.1 EexN family lipoprotein [Polaromonas sp.]